MTCWPCKAVVLNQVHKASRKRLGDNFHTVFFWVVTKLYTFYFIEVQPKQLNEHLYR